MVRNYEDVAIPESKSEQRGNDWRSAGERRPSRGPLTSTGRRMSRKETGMVHVLVRDSFASGRSSTFDV